MTNPKKRPRRPRNETTSKRVATKAGRLMRLSRRGYFYWTLRPLLISERAAKEWSHVTELVEAVAGSALTQKAKRKRRK